MKRRRSFTCLYCGVEIRCGTCCGAQPCKRLRYREYRALAEGRQFMPPHAPRLLTEFDCKSCGEHYIPTRAKIWPYCLKPLCRMAKRAAESRRYYARKMTKVLRHRCKARCPGYRKRMTGSCLWCDADVSAISSCCGALACRRARSLESYHKINGKRQLKAFQCGVCNELYMGSHKAGIRTPRCPKQACKKLSRRKAFSPNAKEALDVRRTRKPCPQRPSPDGEMGSIYAGSHTALREACESSSGGGWSPASAQPSGGGDALLQGHSPAL